MKYPQSTVYQCNFIHIPARHFQACSGVQTRFSLVPRRSKLGGGEGLVYTVCACALISQTPGENIILLYSSVLPLRMMMNWQLYPPTAKFDHGSVESMACRSSCPELSECVSHALHKLQMTDITLKAEQRSAMEAIYNRQDVFCVATYWLWKESVLSSPAIHHGL